MGECSLQQALLSRLASYHRALDEGKTTESELDGILLEAEALVPHANLSDLLFWGERERTDEEAVDEAIKREELWRTKGEVALLFHIEAQLRSALEDPTLGEPYRSYSETELSRLGEKIRAVTKGETH